MTSLIGGHTFTIVPGNHRLKIGLSPSSTILRIFPEFCLKMSNSAFAPHRHMPPKNTVAHSPKTKSHIHYKSFFFLFCEGISVIWCQSPGYEQREHNSSRLPPRRSRQSKSKQPLCCPDQEG